MRNYIVRLFRRFGQETNVIGLEQRLQNRAWDEAVEFIENNRHRGCDFHNSVESIRRTAFKGAPGQGLLLEFGVNRGRSIRFFSKLLKESGGSRKIYGFDNFLGLTEDWTGMGGDDAHRVRKDYFDLGGVAPRVSDNVELLIGDVEDTLTPFLEKQNKEKIAFIHIDTDTYKPCKLILENCKPYLSRGSIILFDQLLGYPGYRFHEYAALMETFDLEEYEFLAFGIAQERSNLIKAAIRYRVDR